MAHDLGDGGIDAVKDEVEDKAGNIGRHEDNSAGAHDSRTRVLFSRNFGGDNV